MSEFIPSLLSSPIVQICMILFTSGLVYGLLNGQIEIDFPGGKIGGKEKKDK
jgi:hypothetical protein